MLEDGNEKLLKRYEMIAPLLNDKLDAFERRRLRVQILEAYGISARSLRRYIHTYKGHQKFCSAKPLPMVAPDFFPVPGVQGPIRRRTFGQRRPARRPGESNRRSGESAAGTAVKERPPDHRNTRGRKNRETWGSEPHQLESASDTARVRCIATEG